MKPPKLGNVNGFVKSCAWLGVKRFEFDGTVKGLARSAHANGSKVGDTILANFGGRLKSDARKMQVISAPHDDRAHGIWIV